MHQVDRRRQKQQSKLPIRAIDFDKQQDTFHNDERLLQFITKCFICPYSSLSKLTQNLTAWRNLRKGSRGGKASCNRLITAIMLNDSPLRISWSIPWALSRHSYEESHQQKFYLIYCYHSWILSAKSRRKKFSQKDNKVGYFYHFTLKHKQWSLAGWGGAISRLDVSESLKWSNCIFRAHKFSVRSCNPVSVLQKSRELGTVFWGHLLVF